MCSESIRKDLRLVRSHSYCAWADIDADGFSPELHGFQKGRATANEGIEYDVLLLRIPENQVARNLRCPVTSVLRIVQSPLAALGERPTRCSGWLKTLRSQLNRCGIDNGKSTV